MADRGNVPDNDKVHSRSDDQEIQDYITDYPFSAYHPFHFHSLPPENDPEDYYGHHKSGPNSRSRLCWVSNCNVTGKDDNDEAKIENSEEKGENSEESGESDNEDAGSCDYIEHLGLSADDGNDETGENEEDNTTFEDEDTDSDEEDETGRKNPFKWFLKCSHLFIRNIIRKACDSPPPTPRE